jgi:putative redox protein
MIINARTQMREDNIFETDVNGVRLTLDTGSGKAAGQSPVHAVLSAIASCSAVDVVEIIRKKRKDVIALEIETKGDRVEDSYPKKYNSIHLHFKVTSKTASQKDIEQAVSLSVDKYCSVAGMLNGNAKITFSAELLSA